METGSCARNVLNVPDRMLLLAGSSHANGPSVTVGYLQTSSSVREKEGGREGGHEEK